MVLKRFIGIYKKVNGREILRQYWHAHVLFFALVEMMILGLQKKSLEIVRLAVNDRVLGKLRKKYRPFIEGYKKNVPKDRGHEHSEKVWVCWLQGMDRAPELVQKCYGSLLEHLGDREIILLTDDNYRAYVQFPVYIQEKIDSGVITKTHMSDLLRLELLNRYGGTWIDATVYCSGNDIPDYILDSDLFLYQNLKPGRDGHCTYISSWFITACTDHPILRLTQELLYEYWKKNKKMIDYYLFHDFFQLSLEAYPDEWDRVIPACNSIPHILLLRLFEKYDEKTWHAIKGMTSFHKLSYKSDERQMKMRDTYYDVLFNR